MPSVEEVGNRAPMFSICLATMNAFTTLERAFESIVSQDTEDYEIVVSDGGSTDGTLDIINRYGKTIRCVSEPDDGIADAWNKAVRRARGRWLYFLGADDMLASNHVLSSAAVGLEEVRGLVAYGDVSYVNAAGQEVCRLGPEWDREQFRRYGMVFSHQGAFHRRELFETYGLFNTSFRIATDYEFLLRYLKDNDATHLSDCMVARVQFGGVSTKDVNVLSALLENRRAQRQHGLHGNSAAYYRALAGALVKYVIVRLVGEERGGRWIDAIRPLVGRPHRANR